MKPIIAHKPHLTARIVTSLMLQILLVVLLRQHHQDSLFFNLGIMVVAFLAMVLVAFVPRWLSFWTVILLRSLGLFPVFVFLAALLNLLGWHAMFDWLHRFCAGVLAFLWA